MNKYVVLLRGVNVGGKNRVPMAELKKCLEEIECSDVRTYIQSGNAVLQSKLGTEELGKQIEKCLQQFATNDEDIKVLVLPIAKLREVVEKKPKGFGEQPDKYHSDVIFLIGVAVSEVLPIFNPREGVDTVWAGDGVIYSQRLSAQRTKSRLSAIVASPLYKSMTIRNWNTTTKLLAMAEAA